MRESTGDVSLARKLTTANTQTVSKISTFLNFMMKLIGNNFATKLATFLIHPQLFNII